MSDCTYINKNLENCVRKVSFDFYSLFFCFLFSIFRLVLLHVIVHCSIFFDAIYIILLWRFIHPGNLNAKCLKFSRMYLDCLGSFQSLL